MDDLVTWVRAQLDARVRELDEDERVALAATQAEWWHNPGKLWLGPEAFEAYDHSKGEEFVGYGESPFSGCVAATGPGSHPQAMADAKHIARWDPERVLRQVADGRAEVEAVRRILDEYEMWAEGHDPARAHEFAGTTAGFAAMVRVVQLLALPMAGREGYRDAWRP